MIRGQNLRKTQRIWSIAVRRTPRKKETIFGEDEWEFPALEVTLARLGTLAACQPGSEASSFTIGRQDAVPPT
ncbi:MAG: hypothetical protein DME84_03255 [Verrucomicrobia bacterium]|nr:MAG: hypothetical protein DME84_03255 [Verrucomicrobiota bacterium]